MAARHYREALDLWLSCEDGRGTAGTVAGIAAVAIARGQLERASRLLGAAWGLGESLGVRYLAHHVYAERVLAPARAHLDEPTLEHCWQDGRALTIDDAVGEAKTALDIGKPVVRPRPV
jgi:hypothetical protein